MEQCHDCKLLSNVTDVHFSEQNATLEHSDM